MDVRDLFRGYTNYDIDGYFQMYTDFVDNDYQNLLDFYSGDTDIFDSTVRNLEELKNQTKILNDIFYNNVQNLTSNAQFWELLILFEDISVKVDTMVNSPKWLRSNIITGTYNRNISVDYVQKQGQTLENISAESGSTNSDLNWANIALNNDIPEEGYTLDGGAVLSVELQNVFSLDIQTVVGSLVGKNIYGKDIQREILLEDNDLKILTNEETIQQSFDILLGLNRGSVPQFPEDGVDKRLVIGSNVGSLAYPSIFRQLSQTFMKDDSFKNISVLNVQQEKDSLILEISATTRLNDTIQSELII